MLDMSIIKRTVNKEIPYTNETRTRLQNNIFELILGLQSLLQFDPLILSS